MPLILNFRPVYPDQQTQGARVEKVDSGANWRFEE